MSVLSKASEILEGWAKYKGLMKISISEEKIVEDRAATCAACPHIQESNMIAYLMEDNKLKEIQGHKCGLCGCPLSTKVRSTTSKCPDKRWKE